MYKRQTPPDAAPAAIIPNNNNAFFIIQYRNNLTGFITEAILSHGLFLFERFYLVTERPEKTIIVFPAFRRVAKRKLRRRHTE